MRFSLKAVAAANDGVSVELPGAALSRRHSRDGSTRLAFPLRVIVLASLTMTTVIPNCTTISGPAIFRLRCSATRAQCATLPQGLVQCASPATHGPPPHAPQSEDCCDGGWRRA